ncbi:hypothetical protein I4P27_11060 [Enterobacter roggenkampii]|uniref:hypothetical protein n=1 Tax=Enterobacter vonholyi TaxID=2797505 RepID=UPI0018C28EC2|nr:hypothetical protein [Enterobacter vonholyi]MBG0624966.1 hypothetical protein [Enterobacter roggenkampii]MEB5978995.1 hypothetical protein [Enterobacter vonholyi]
MFHQFLLTYSVQNVGRSWDQDKANDVRDNIHELTINRIIDLEDGLHDPFYGWDKLSMVETTVKGSIDVGEGTLPSKRSKALKAVTSLFKRILKDNNARANTTVIHCAILINSMDEVLEFDVSY